MRNRSPRRIRAGIGTVMRMMRTTFRRLLDLIAGRGRKNRRVWRFSADTRAAHPGEEDFDRIEEIYDALLRLKIPEVRAAALSPVAKLPHETSVLFQVGLRRGIEQIESCVREVNAGSLAPLFVAARGLLETVAVVADVWESVKRAVDTWDGGQIENLDKRLMDTLFGSRTPGWGDPVKVPAVNILTILGRLSKALKLERNLEEPYGGLSEHGHPNFTGMMGSYQRLDAPNFQLY